MRTPVGRECDYFYGDYYRGRQREVCRLLSSTSPPLTWSSDLCRTCPVPDIRLANNCQYMQLIPRLERPFLSLRRQVKISAYCQKSQTPVDEPKIGCGQCHPLPPIFFGETNDVDDAD